MALETWPEVLAATATYCVRGAEGVDEVLSWLALARMNYGYAWRVLVNWELLKGMKDHPKLRDLLAQDDTQVAAVEKSIDEGVFTL